MRTERTSGEHDVAKQLLDGWVCIERAVAEGVKSRVRAAGKLLIRDRDAPTGRDMFRAVDPSLVTFFQPAEILR